MRLRSFVLSFAVALAAPLAGHAQCNPVPATGCGNARAVLCGGAAQIGQPLRVQCPPSVAGVLMPTFLVLGRCPTAPLTLFPPLVCGNAPCTVGVELLGSAAAQVPNTGTIVLSIPNNPRLVGLKLCMQCASIDPTRACLTLSQAVDFTIVP
jgi:hypothetical protein